MKLSGKCKDDFWEWMNPTGMPSDYKFGQMLGSNFESLPKSMQWGVIQDFADSVGYHLNAKYECDEYCWCYCFEVVFNKEYDISDFNFDTRQQARIVAVEKFNELYNK